MESSSTPEVCGNTPPLNDPLSDAARAAFDVLYRRIAEPRIEEQQATIARLQQELAQKDEILKKELEKKDRIIASMKCGHGLCVRDVLERYPCGRFRLEPSLYDMKLDRFLMLFAISWGHLKEAQDVFRVASASNANVGISDKPASTLDASAYTRRLAVA